jgi:KipI family sensor histidine kinase inhibitor
LPMGATAVLVDEIDDPVGWALAFERLDVAGVVDVVPAARTVLVVTDDEGALAAAVASFEEVRIGVATERTPDVVEITVVYDGPDLAEVATEVGMSVDDVVTTHADATYRVAFCGFAPGFAYLSGLPTALHLARRPTPRTRVPAGSVAIASEYSAVYPTVSPGGWHLLGSTALGLFDAQRDPPALLTPGTIVRFVAT